MEDLKPRAKITLIVGTTKIIFSGAKKAAQIVELSSGVEVRANKLSAGFRFRADGYRSQEVSFDQIRAANFKITLTQK